MPELPEVESIRLQLKKYLIGHKIERIEVGWRKTLPNDEEKLVGGEVEKVRRFGKALSIDLDNNYSAIVHVKMTGQLIYRGPNLKNPPDLSEKIVGGVPGKHTHVIFYLDKGGKLFFNDYRKFGWIHVTKNDEVKKHEYIRKLGPEPLDGLNNNTFRKIVLSTSRPIKVLLMDQRKISGVGNIYANDALWLAGINPKRKSKSLSKQKTDKLFGAIETVLSEGIREGGASEQAFVTPDGSIGQYQKHTLVYAREGQLCNRCGKKIKKLKLSGRGTYYCAYCQK